MEKARKERWGILTDGILMPGFESQDEAEKYIKSHPNLRNPVVVQLGCDYSRDEWQEGFWWD
jgi:hypothetical protein